MNRAPGGEEPRGSATGDLLLLDLNLFDYIATQFCDQTSCRAAIGA